ncbi:MAG: hypothetical protein EBU27_04040, partial [Opitutae bacterium]|nr:hypothetical protein [Opitutae bacterium]
MQNLVSYSNLQDGVLATVGSIIDRMGELATRALDITANSDDRENYNKEFLELADQLDKLKNESFNGIDLFGAGSFSDDGYAAFVMTSQNPADGTADVVEMQFDLPDFYAPHTSPTSTADRTVAHEMVHLMQAQNSYYGDITGDNNSRGTWFKEGLAEFIHGADSDVANLLSGGTSVSDLAAAIGTGNEGWSSAEQYATGYLAVKYLHSRIQASGQADGVKHMTTWMKTQFDTSQGASNSGI